MPKRSHTPPPIEIIDGVGRVQLTQEKFALVDEADVPIVQPHVWYARKSRRTFYAGTNNKLRESPRVIKMHQLLMGTVGTRVMTDHINGNGLDNRRANLRVASNQQNTWNGRPRGDGYKGTCEVPQGWIAQITVQNERLHLGTFLTPEDAARAYDQAARRHFGEYAQTNFEDETPPQTYLTSNQLAKKLGVSKPTIARWAKEGKLEFVTTPGGHRRFAESETPNVT